MLSKEWGNAIWHLFHALAHKLKSGEDEHANELFMVFRRICDNLPCPKCREHANKIMSRRRTVHNKADLERFMWKFHNIVNSTLKKTEMTYEAYVAQYDKANTWRIIQHFVRTMRKNMRIPNMMLDSFRRQTCVSNFVEYIERNKHRFER
jgi:hypothetical protein